jgi:hypothetical protein
MFSRSRGRFMDGDPNHNIREERDRHGQVVVERQTRSLWGTRYGKWERDGNEINHKGAREHAERNGKM